ncbi:MAG TPA: glyoxalase, partial [Terriglobus sp.]
MSTVNIISAIRYRDCNRMIDWLKQAFDFHEHAVYRGEDGTVHHAELVLGNGMIMLGTVGTNPASADWYVQPDETGNRVTSSLYLVV